MYRKTARREFEVKPPFASIVWQMVINISFNEPGSEGYTSQYTNRVGVCV